MLSAVYGCRYHGVKLRSWYHDHMNGTLVRWAQGWLWEQAELVAQQALANGVLQPIHTTITHLPAGQANFLIHQLDGGADALDQKLTRSPFAGNHDFREFNPFLPVFSGWRPVSSWPLA